MPDFFNTCDVTGDLTETEVTTGYMPMQPHISRETASPLTLTTSWQRLDLSTSTANTFGATAGPSKLVDWDATNKYFTFNDNTTRNYLATINLKTTMTGITLAPLTSPIYVQFRFVVPDGNGPGSPYFFPFTNSDGYMDLQEVAYNSSMRHQRLTPITSNAMKRATGVGCEVRINANPLTGSVQIPFFSVYMFGA